MKLPDSIALSRDARLALITAVLAATGAIGVDRGWYVTGALLWLAAAAIVAAFYLLVVRPARIPKDAVLTLRIADGLREDAPRSPLEQLRSRGAADPLPSAPGARSRRARSHAQDGRPRNLGARHRTRDRAGAARPVTRDRRGRQAGRRRPERRQVTIRDYLLACGASEVVVNPDSAIMMLGVAAGGVFLKNALARPGSRRKRCNGRNTRARPRCSAATACRPKCARASRRLSTIGRHCGRTCGRVAQAQRRARPRAYRHGLYECAGRA